MVAQDPPSTLVSASCVASGFTPRQARTVEPTQAKLPLSGLKKLRANGGGDIVTELFKPSLPSMVVVHYLGVPEEDYAIRRWTQPSWLTAPPTGALDVVGSMMAYHRAGSRRRTEPADDAISHLVAAGVGADRRHRRHTVHTGVHVLTMVTGGNDTVTVLGGRCRCCTGAAPGPAPAATQRASPTRAEEPPRPTFAGAGAGAHNHARRHDR